jgi:hypothetical protein
LIQGYQWDNNDNNRIFMDLPSGNQPCGWLGNPRTQWRLFWIMGKSFISGEFDWRVYGGSNQPSVEPTNIGIYKYK